MDTLHNQSLKTAEGTMKLFLSFDDSIPVEKQTDLPKLVRKQEFRVIPPKHKKFFAKTVTGEIIAVKTKKRIGSRAGSYSGACTGITLMVVPIKQRKK